MTLLPALYRQVHEQLRQELEDVADDDLHVALGPGMNSIAVLLRHLLGSELETLRAVAGVAAERDRDAEFVVQPLTHTGALRLLDDADRFLDELAPLITPERLLAVVALPTLSPDDRRPGGEWLVANYGHAREHVGQIQITKQVVAGR